jgi:hypothetical protein
MVSWRSGAKEFRKPDLTFEEKGEKFAWSKPSTDQEAPVNSRSVATTSALR